MNILITGATGLLGSALIPLLVEKGHKVATLSRKPIQNSLVDSYLWDVDKQYVDPKAFEQVDAIIHLAGENVSEGRWSEKRKKALYDSRIKSTQLLKNVCNTLERPIQLFMSASGISYYGVISSDAVFKEEDSAGNDFLARLTQDWERESDECSAFANRVVKLRISMVLSNNGGALKKLLDTMKFGPAAIIGNGNQYMPWIHLTDMVRAIVFLLENEKTEGAFNMVADQHIRNSEFMKTLALAKNRPAIKVPAFVMRLLLGEMACLLLKGSRASNFKLKEAGFEFEFQTLKQVLEAENI